MRVLHIYAVNGSRNSGDFFLGPATKSRFCSIVDQDVTWSNFDVRKIVTDEDIEYFNSFDCIVIGGGGLFLPDSNPNKISCWQWACPTHLIERIKSDIYVLGVGWNHFYGQTILMSRSDNFEDSKRGPIFKRNIECLVRKSKMFYMRHSGDCDKLKSHIDESLHDKIQFDFCPVVPYVQEKYKQFKSEGEYHTFELKDDRLHRRYNSKSIQKVYEELLEAINNIIRKGEKVAIMSHDGSRSFYEYTRGRGLYLPFIDNTIANEEKIIENYSKVKHLYCTAGHSQMMAYALNIPFTSLITHDKLKYFLDDLQEDRPRCFVNDEDINQILLKDYNYE
jgi:hypothetical protein